MRDKARFESELGADRKRANPEEYRLDVGTTACSAIN
jgi:hypothetical protein